MKDDTLGLKYKAELRVSTAMYEFINVTVEDTPEEIVRIYQYFTELVKPQPISNVDSKEWRDLYDAVASGTAINGDPGVLDKLNPLQRFAINEAKKRIKRLNK